MGVLAAAGTPTIWWARGKIVNSFRRTRRPCCDQEVS